ncbi:TonB-dependent receptor plug domain-containing protein [Pseudomonas alabamensis]|uniref:TonB-dependent receptor plug domain-containing protein n=1 Tax=Pseudomonas alabamensis TaxID=3064349 RepID=UPI000AD415FA
MHVTRRHTLRLAIRRATLATGLGAAAVGSGPVWAAADQTLGTVTVQAARQSEAQKASSQLADIPGGTSVVDSEEVAKGRTATLQDTLGYQPGVFVQSTGGNDAAKISIRGSGRTPRPATFARASRFSSTACRSPARAARPTSS